MDYVKAVSRILDNIEEDKVDRAVMGCLRVARHAKDHLNAALFLRELYPDRLEVGRMIFDDMPNLKEEAQKFIFKISLERWLEIHTLDFSLSSDKDGDERNVLRVGVGEIDPELDQWERAIDDMKLSSGMDPFDIAAFTDSFRQQKAEIRLRIRALNTIKARIRTRCLNYAVQIEKQLHVQQQQQGFLDAVQNDVNNFFKARSDDVYSKLQKAAQLAASKDLEDSSLLLTEVRRALKSVADHYYPAVAGRVMCSDGIERKLGDEQYLNRLQEFLNVGLPQSTSRELLQSELEHLASFIRRLNDMASKGVHATVSLAELKQGLVGLYFFLFNLAQHMTFRIES
ncbi:hypothetical protein MAUB1S_10095 [Mycolicibacterium aubagnense]